MYKGDISNELPKRILVTTDVFLKVEVTSERRFKIIPVVYVDKSVRLEVLSSLYLFTTKRGVTLELISYDLDHKRLEEVMDFLDSRGTNPFRYYSPYSSIDRLVGELPYRPEVIGVLDKPDNILRYGHWGLDFNSL